MRLAAQQNAGNRTVLKQRTEEEGGGSLPVLIVANGTVCSIPIFNCSGHSTFEERSRIGKMLV